jgi:thiamine transport system ATP-binding protein
VVIEMLDIRALTYTWSGESETTMQFDLSVAAGEVLALIGPSGAGKSTLLNLIAGFLSAQSGQISIDNERIEALPISERPVSMVFQQHNLFPHLDLYTNVGLGINPSMHLSEQQREAVNYAFDRLGLAGLERRKPGEISGGQRQRVTLARVLVRERKVLLLDEAFAALGPAQRAEMIELVATLVSEKSMAALLVSHQPGDARIASARTAFVADGKIVEIANTEDMLERSGLAEVRDYLGSF